MQPQSFFTDALELHKLKLGDILIPLAALTMKNSCNIRSPGTFAQSFPLLFHCISTRQQEDRENVMSEIYDWILNKAGVILGLDMRKFKIFRNLECLVAVLLPQTMEMFLPKTRPV